MLKSLLRGAFAFTLVTLFAPSAVAQCTGAFASGSLCGNGTGSPGIAASVTISAMFDRVFGNTQNQIIYRGASNWAASTTLPSAVQDNITRVGTIVTTVNLTSTIQETLANLDTKINRFADRVFIGAAVTNNGPAAFPGTDWCSQLYLQSYNGGPGIQCDTSYAQAAILFDPNSNAAATAIPQPALVVAAEALNSPVGATPRGFEFMGVNNSPLGLTVWGAYGEAHRVVAGAGQTYGFELEVRNSVSSVTGWTPYTQPGFGTIGGQIACGAGLSATGQFPCTVALLIGANPMQLGAGILFGAGGIGAYGTGGTKPAILMPYDYEIQWYTAGTTIGAHIVSGPTGNLYFKSIDTFLFDNNVNMPEGKVISFGAFSSYFGGSSTSGNLTFNTGSTERGRFMTGFSVGTTSDPGVGLIYLNSASFLMRNKTSWSNGAAASAGTLANAPAAGNPTKWIPIDDNGTTRYIPAW